MEFGRATGPLPARILVVGEAFGADEEREGVPFVGASGRELTRMLGDAGIDRATCRITNVVNARPPGNDISAWFGKPDKCGEPNELLQAGLKDLRGEIERTGANCIVALGRTALWALTENTAIGNWRGSLLEVEGCGTKVVPTYHPAAILRDWSLRWITVTDLRRAFRESFYPEVREPTWQFALAPTFAEARERLEWLLANPCKLACDVETIRHRIALLGLAWSPTEALALPFATRMRPDGYYTPEEEWELVRLMRKLLRSPAHPVIWQNGLYDAQHLIREYALWPRMDRDTMLYHHTLYPGTDKSLDFLSSIYRPFHRYWKDDLKDYKTLPEDDAKFQRYNCIDTTATWEVDTVLVDLVRRQGMQEQADFQMDVARAVLQMMVRGVPVSDQFRRETLAGLTERGRELEAWFGGVVG